MTTYAVTGTSGHLGRLIVEHLRTRGVPESSIVALARTTSKVADLAAEGITTRYADYTDAASLDTALEGVDRLILVSGSEVGQRFAQHSAVIAAAERAGVSRIVYTSLLKADTSTLGLAPEHLATEQALAASPIPATILRNSWYLENYTGNIEQYRTTGTVLGATANATITAATRADYAEAAAAAAIQDSEGQIYELAGAPFTFDDLAAVVSTATDTAIEHRNVTVEELTDALVAATGMDQATAGFWASVDESIARGDLHSDSADLATLLGRAPHTLTDAVKAAVA